MVIDRKAKRKPQWDDWFCYRCGRRQAQNTGVAKPLALPAGQFTLLLCAQCAEANP